MIRSIAMCIGVLLSGCTVIPTSGRAGDHVYLGLVRVKLPKATGPLVVADVKTLGLGFDGAAFLGWRNSKFVYAKPEECRVVIVVRDRADLASVETIVKSMEGACITGTGASSSRASPPSP